MFAVLGTTLLMGSAMAIDVARMFSYHNKLTFAVDAAALATTQGLTQGDIALEDAEAAVRKYLDANLDGRNLTPENVVIDSIDVDKANRTVEVDAHTIMPMTMTGIVGYDNHRIDASTKAKFSNTEVEVVMALDITGSMGSKISYYSSDTKLDTLKTAAKNAVETLFTDTGSEDRIRVGLVPYSASVNVAPVIDKIQTTPAQEYVCTTTGWGWRRRTTCSWVTSYPDCVYERTGTQKFTDAFADSTAKIPRSTNTCPSAEIMPLTDNETALKNRINSFSANGSTAGHIAIAWSYYMLSSKWNSAWPLGSEAADYNAPGARKYAIIMTDGEFNTFESGGGDAATNSRNYALGLCDSMKGSGIKIYSIAFAANSTAKTLMQSCASTNTATSKYYYDATNETALD
ncbi:pilus assembly protein, partial [Oricola nitratireducens]|uniref:pilus assembly protein n=1 Tax=Oricola nitratireducens TaxID=2775868 RepID=UPI0018683BFC